MKLVKSLTLGAVLGIATLGTASAQSSGLYDYSTQRRPQPAPHWTGTLCRSSTTSTGNNFIWGKSVGIT